MSRSDQLDELFEKWIQHHRQKNIANAEKRFSRDGILNEELSNKARMRVLFVLREVNGEDENQKDLETNEDERRKKERYKEYKHVDLIQLLKDGPKYQMWHAIARWSAGILRRFPPFEEVDDYATMKDSLLSVAAINLKKTPGGADADLEKVNAYARMDRRFIIDQIEIIDPDIIVACGTFSHLIWLLDLEVDSDDPLSKVSVKGKWKVVPWCHPGRVNNKTTYEDLEKKVGQYI